eukprot:767368-Hanusia_phi.AAC.4
MENQYKQYEVHSFSHPDGIETFSAAGLLAAFPLPKFRLTPSESIASKCCGFFCPRNQRQMPCVHQPDLWDQEWAEALPSC